MAESNKTVSYTHLLNSATYFTISSADCEVFEDKILTCSATTEKPFPASPALAA